MKILDYILMVIVIGVTFSYIIEYLKNKITYKFIKRINWYQKALGKEDILIKHKGKSFVIVVDYLIDDPIYKCLLYINEELCLTGIELNHGNTNSRQLEYNHKRSETEINKLIRLTYKKYKNLYYEKYIKIDYSYESFYDKKKGDLQW